MKARETIVRRTARLTLLGAASQPIGALALAVGAHVLGGPWWAPHVFVPFTVLASLYILRERARYGAPRPGGFFVMMCAGVSLAVVAGGLLRSPVLFALGTLPVGSAALGPSLAYARKIQVWMLGLLALAVIGDLAGLSLAEAEAFVDRESRAPGFYIGTTLTFLVILTGVALGGLATRQLRLAIDEAEAVSALARSELLASLEARTRDLMLLAGSLSAELAEPIANLRRRADEIRARTTSKAVSERLGVLIAELERVERRLVRHETFARTEHHATRVALAPLVEELVGSVEGLASARGVTVSRDLDPSLTVIADREKLYEVLENLLQNAIDASPHGGRVELAAVPTDTGLEITIQDEGPGLGGAAGKIFTAGFTTKAQGSGLGLVLSRSLASQLGGTLELVDRTDGRSGALARLAFSSPRPGAPR